MNIRKMMNQVCQKISQSFLALEGVGGSPTSLLGNIFPLLNQERKKKTPTTQPQIENVFFCNWKQTLLMALTAACQHGLRNRQAQTFFEINTCTDIQYIRSNYKSRNKRTNKQASAFSSLLHPTPPKLDSEAQKSGFQGVSHRGSRQSSLRQEKKVLLQISWLTAGQVEADGPAQLPCVSAQQTLRMWGRLTLGMPLT